MASFFIPSSIQKRLLRYALSRVDLLDTDGLDLGQLDIAWGKRSTVELKDVGLNKGKFGALLSLPEQFSLNAAVVTSVKITVPADIHTSSIIITIQGVRVAADVHQSVGSRKTDLSQNHKKHTTIPSTSAWPNRAENREEIKLPTSHDLAKSFLAEEPLSEKRELEAALASQPADIRQSIASLASNESEFEEGVGTGIGLPGFLAAFFRGIGERLQINILDVVVRLDVSGLYQESRDREQLPLEFTTLGFQIGSIEVNNPSIDSASQKDQKHHVGTGNRQVVLKNIRSFLSRDGQVSSSPDNTGAATTGLTLSDEARTSLYTSSDLSDHGATLTTATGRGNGLEVSSYSLHDALRDCRQDKDARSKQKMAPSGLATPEAARSSATIQPRANEAMRTSSISQSQVGGLALANDLGFCKIPSPTTAKFESKSSEVDLSRSMLFTSDEAESLYLSAIETSLPSRSFRAPMPGGWGMESEDEVLRERPYSLPRGGKQVVDQDSRGSATLAALSGGFIRTFMSVAEVSLLLPGHDAPSPSVAPHSVSTSRTASGSTSRSMTGSFSTYADTRHNSSRDAKLRPQLSNATSQKQDNSTSSSTEVVISAVSVQADIATLKILVDVGMRLQAMTTKNVASGTKAHEVSAQYPLLNLVVKSLTIDLVKELREEILATPTINHQEHSLLGIHLRDVTLASSETMLILESEKAVLNVNDEQCLLFDDQAKIRSSVRDLSEQSVKDIRVEICNVPGKREVHLKTRVLKIEVDLPKLENGFESFGGLSAFLDLAVSAAPGLVLEATPVTSPRSRSVRFDVHSKAKEAIATTGLKLYARVDGVSVMARSSRHTVSCTTSAMKITSRANLNGVQVDDIRIQGPTESQSGNSAPDLRILNLRLVHLAGPEEPDLTRLIELLTPSKDRFEDDDDLLVDTLIRQRRKGPVLRVTASSIQLDVASMTSALSAGAEFVEDLSRLSAFAKYLPQDDRPQLMTLAKIGSIILNIETEHSIGPLTLSLEDSDFAHVGLPSLLACSVGKLALDRDDCTNVVAQLVGRDATVSSPMLMARMIGDDLVPTIKLKLWNVVFEYSIPLVLSAMGLSDLESTGTLIADVAASITSLLGSHSVKPLPVVSPKHPSESAQQPLKVHLVLKECAIGLTPRRLQSKALVLFSSAKVVGSLPTDDSTSCQLDIRKGGILIIDDVQKSFSATVSTVPPSSSTDYDALLCHKGYVSISTISAAVIDVRLRHGQHETLNALEIGFKDELFVLETCADSTQTLIETLNDLMPPLPPPKGNHYRTEVAPMEDMMASFSGDAFTVPPVPDSEAASARQTLGNDSDSELDFEDLGFADVGTAANAAYPSVANGSGKRQGRFGSAPHRLRGKEDYKPASLATSRRRVTFAKKWDSVNNVYTPLESTDLASTPLRVKVRDVHFIWNMFDGYDWQKTRDTISKAVYDVENKAQERRRRSAHDDEQEDEPVIGDFLFNSIYIGVPINADPQELTRQINKHMDDLVSETASLASTTTSRPSTSHRRQHPQRKLKLERSKRHKLAIELRGVSADIFAFPPGTETQTSIDIRVTDLEIFDHVPTSTWKKFATYMHDAGPRVDGKPMVHLEVCNVRPIPELLASELVIKVSV